MKNLMSRGLRPSRATDSRTSATSLRKPSLVWLDTNTHSACRAAKAWPRPDEPAWYSTGVRCGDGSDRWKPCTL
ncbi:hypothetical protein G6F59_019009 [Rhizopus arrhizus]|nr:hypothetical protein G6F59_019009 [Rhizopus arrhizus]